jgi:arginyl-tRNA synthetase
VILPVQHDVSARLRAVVQSTFGLAPADVPAIVIELPPRRALGDLAVPVAFELARQLRKPPRVIAQELAAALGPIDGVTRVVAAPNGYLNVYLDRGAFLARWLAPAAPEPSGAPAADKVIVEHTAINPNKAAHIGHLRNAALGDTLVRVLRFQGATVEVQNYIDDTGVQVADVVVGFMALEGRDTPAVRALSADPAVRFDYYCWDLYARVTEWYEADASRLAARARTLHAIESGGTPEAEMGALVADQIVRRHLDTMARMGVGYDLLTWEGDILRRHFWATAFDELKARGAVFLRTEGRLAGCWVMAIDDPSVPAPPEPGSAAAGEEERDAGGDEAEPREKVIVRSNGTVTYVGKDMANQFWKFGLLGRDFYYRVFAERDGRSLWATTSEPPGAPAPPAFGRAAAVYNVIDSRQAYLQQLLKQALASIGFTREAERSTHFSYEMVALSHATARALGHVGAEDAGRPFVEVSGRKGLGVKADDLMDQMEARAAGEVASRQPELPEADVRRTAHTIARAALRYFLIKFSRGKVIVFDIDEALSFEGETGPYIQYAAVRAANILAKLADRDGMDEAALIEAIGRIDRGPIDHGEGADELWGLVLEAARLDEVVLSSIRSLELSTLAKYAFALAQAFNAFYHRQSILKEEHEAARLWRASAVLYVRRQLSAALGLMGCDVPARM